MCYFGEGIRDSGLHYFKEVMILQINFREVTVILKLEKVNGLPRGLFINKPQFAMLTREDVKLHSG